MARLDLAPAVVGYLEKHAIDVDLALELGIRSGPGDSTIRYPYSPPRGEPYVRTRDLNDERKLTRQPKDTPLTLWWPAGRAEPGAEVLLCEGEPDALAALSALNGIPVAVAALPGDRDPRRADHRRARPCRAGVPRDGRRRRRQEGRRRDREGAADVHRAPRAAGRRRRRPGLQALSRGRPRGLAARRARAARSRRRS